MHSAQQHNVRSELLKVQTDKFCVPVLLTWKAVLLSAWLQVIRNQPIVWSCDSNHDTEGLLNLCTTECTPAWCWNLSRLDGTIYVCNYCSSQLWLALQINPCPSVASKPTVHKPIPRRNEVGARQLSEYSWIFNKRREVVLNARQVDFSDRWKHLEKTGKINDHCGKKWLRIIALSHTTQVDTKRFLICGEENPQNPLPTIPCPVPLNFTQANVPLH